MSESQSECLEYIPDVEVVEGIIVNPDDQEDDNAVQPPEFHTAEVDPTVSLEFFKTSRRKTSNDIGPRESLEDKFNRLKSEVQDFLEQVKVAESVNAGNAKEQESLASMAQEVQQLQEHLLQANVDSALKSRTGPSKQPDNAGQDAMKKIISGLKQASKDDPKSTGSNDQKGITYELYYTPEQAKFVLNANIAKLESRIQELEKTVGKPNLGALAHFLDEAELSLASAVQSLASKVDTLSDSNVDKLGKRLHDVLKQVSEIKALKTERADLKSKDADGKSRSDYAEKVEEIYQTTQRWDQTSAILPQLIKRMKNLKALHEQAACFASTLSHVEAVQGQLRDQLANQTVALKTMESTFKSNMETVTSNLEAISNRIKALEGK